MIRSLLVVFISVFALTAQAHVGSPDIFYDGTVGPYPARISIRMPGVIPGRAGINVRVDAKEPVEVSFRPLYSRTAVKNAPPPDVGGLIPGETNLYAGELWLMSFGAYSVEVRIKGERGDGLAQIPVTSMATRQLPLPSMLGKLLALLATTLVVGGIGIAAAAGREATLLPGAILGKAERRRGFFAAASAAIIFILTLTGGRYWWSVEERDFRRHLREGAWPDIAADVRETGSARILRLEIGKKLFQRDYKPSLIPDHGKLMHLFLVREGSRDAFAHLHPVREDRYTFEAVLPPLPEGRYTIFCDLTYEGGASSTASTSVLLPPAPAGDESGRSTRDADDSWAIYLNDAVPAAANVAPVYRLPSGEQVIWKSQTPLRIRHDASLRFAVTDSVGKPIPLEPYMGMLCHAAVLRSDGTVFAHLHPAGNFSMAAQSFFESKLAKESDVSEVENKPGIGGDQDHSMHQGLSGGAAGASVYLPYEFPASGDYRIWVQFKTDGRVITAVFDASVGS